MAWPRTTASAYAYAVESSICQEERDMLKEFRDFAMRGNVVDMAVGIIIGAAFGAIVKSLVADVLMPPVGLLLGQVDFSELFVVLREGATAAPYASLAAAKEAGAVTVNYGLFVNSVISFVIVAFAVFMLIRNLNRLQRTQAPAAPSTKHQGLPALLHSNSDCGNPLPALHLTTVS